MRKRARLPMQYLRRFEPLESRVLLATFEGTSLQAAPVADLGPASVAAAAAQVPTQLAVEHAGIGYFLVTDSPRIERYDIANEAWLPPISLPDNLGPATVVNADDDGLYVAYDKAVYRYGLDGSNPTYLLDAPDTVRGLHIDGNLLFISHTNSFHASLISINKSTNAIIDTFEDFLDLSGSSIAPQFNRLFGRGGSPSDIVYVGYADDGTFTDGDDSPYHGDYPAASRTWAYPNGSKVIDDSGTIYSTAGLMRLGRLGFSISDVAFIGGDIPVVLDHNWLTVYSNSFLQVGTTYLSYLPDEILVNSTHVITFDADPTFANGYKVNLVPLNYLNPPIPDQPVNPVGLAYTPDKVELAADGSVLLYSKILQSVFRWDPVSQSYTQSIPLGNTAEYMAYSAATNTIYLAYASGLIQQIDLDVSDLVETPFATISSRPQGLTTAGPYVFAVQASGTTGRHRTFAPTGELVEEVTGSSYSSEYVWSDANQKMYFLGNDPVDLVSEQINANGSAYPSEPAGGIGQQQDSPAEDGTVFGYPIRVAPDGSLVVLGSGQIHFGTSLARVSTPLANSVVDATWLNGELYTIRTVAGNAELQAWSGPTYAVSHSIYRPGTAYALQTLGDDRMLAITIAAGVPVFTLLNDELQPIELPSAFFTVEETDGATSVSESGTKDTLRVVLNSQPASNVVLKITRIDSTELNAIPSVTFTPGNWNVPQVVTLTPANDSVADGDQWSFVTIAVNDASSDPAFQSAADQFVMVTTFDNETEVSSVMEYEGIGYFLVKNTPRVERYDIANETWLAPIALPDFLGPATALNVDSDGLYVAYDKAVYRYGLDGSNSTHLLNANNPVLSLHSDGNLLFVNQSSTKYPRLTSINKTTNSTIATLSNIYLDSISGLSILPEANRLFGRSVGISPSDIMYVGYADDGTFTVVGESPYHGDYPTASRTWIYPNASKVIDDSGTIYSTSGLSRLGRLGTSINDLEFLGNDIPIVLQGNTLTAYTNTYLPAGSRTLAYTPKEIFVNSTHVITFKTDLTLATGFQVNLVPLSDLNAPTPDQSVNPVGLAYTPDDVELAADGSLLLYSKSLQSIFRWDPASQSYTQSIPLVNTADYVAYSAATNTVYTAYGSGLIQQIDLDATAPVETPFTTLSSQPSALSTAGTYVFTSNAGTHRTFAPNGALVETFTSSKYSSEFVWSEANQKLYFISSGTSPVDLFWEQINASGSAYPGEPAGGIGQQKDSPLHDSSGFVYPIRVAPDGSVVVLGSGQIHAGTSLARLSTPLANSVTDAAWLGGNLYTVRTVAGNAELQGWSKPSYTLSRAIPVPGTAYALKTLDDDRLLAITIDAGVPRFTLLDDELETVDPPVVSAADANGDGMVDGVDYTIWADNFFKHVVGGRVHGDFNADGFVDGADYTMWADNFLQPVESGELLDRSDVKVLVDAAIDASWDQGAPDQAASLPAAAAPVLPDAIPSAPTSKAHLPVVNAAVRILLAHRDVAWAVTVDNFMANHFGDAIFEGISATHWRLKRRPVYTQSSDSVEPVMVKG